ncbi:c-type cytochrome [Niabella hibiscisoli]|uniref:c-type cytochrome n=1 Tax=Niabella hibiscisoli TaxID=1825928 RepID=UPI001F110AD3|nr:cytochrome c [Niabella hibiscisoli]MCH5719698.1 cytochrome c [Niabella hibiscisoli]
MMKTTKTVFLKLALMYTSSLVLSCSADKEDVVTPPPNPPAAEVKFSTQVLPIFQTSCSGCHGVTNPPNGISLTSFAQISANATAAYNAIQADRMPKGGPALSATQKALIKAWIDAGKKDN